MNRGKRKKDVNTIILTGGHAATTAIAVVEELIRRSNSSKSTAWQICWIGVQSAVEGKNVPTLESEVFPKLGVNHYGITAGRLQRKFTLWTIPSLAKIPVGFIQAIRIVSKIKPNVILSFGGFAAFPVVVAGFLYRIPIVVHEQTGHIGLANKFSQIFAKTITLAKKSSLNYVSKKQKSVVVGNPVLTQIALIKPKKRIGNPPVLYITGGSRGSQFLNLLISQIIKKLLSDFIVIHQTGHLDYKKTASLRRKLPKDLQTRYEVYARIDPMQVDRVFKRCDIIVSRAGANTVSEIMITKRPAILIPLPISHVGDQFSNAKIAEDFGVARIVIQGGLTSSKLFQEICAVRDSWKEIVGKIALKKSSDIGASVRLVDLVESVVK